MKILSTFILVIGMITTFCSAQQKIATLADQAIVKATIETYTIKKEQQKVYIENIKNKFVNIKQNAPNLPIGFDLIPHYIKANVTQLNEITAKFINLRELEIMDVKKRANIFIDIRAAVDGKVLEVSFFVNDNPILTLQQIENIEREIKKSNLVSVDPKIEKYIRDSNFLRISVQVFVEDLIKIKKGL